MEKAGVISVFSLQELPSILYGDTPQHGFKGSVPEKGLVWSDTLNLPDKMGRCFPFAKLFRTLNQVLFVRLGGWGKEISLCGSQRRMNGRIESDGIAGKGLMQKAENTCLKRQTPRAPGDDAQAPKQLIVPVQGSRNTPHRRGVSLW